VESLREEVRSKNLSPLWEISEGLFTTEPASLVRPFLWKGKEIISYLMKFGDMVVPGAEVGRRALTLIHPDIKRYGGASWNIQIGFQLVKRGEKAPPHRHNSQASRFMIQGKATTVIDGERVDMEKGDYVITPGWTFHEHLLEDGEYALWLDTLDIPFVTRQGISFFEDYPEPWQEIARSEKEVFRKATQRSLAAWKGKERRNPRPLIYKWKDAYELLVDMANHNETTEYDGVRLSYSDPTTPSGATTCTFGADLTLLKPGAKTKSHRHTSSPIYYVVEGQGYTIVNGERFDWEKHDVLSIPAWAWHEHVNTGNEPAIRLMLHDEPLLNAFVLHREEDYLQPVKYQTIEERAVVPKGK